MTSLRPDRFDEDDFGLPVVPVLGGVFGESLGLTKFLPSGSPVAGTFETRWIDKSFYQEQGMAVDLVPIITETLQ
ncbi:MAG: hypothetical protein HQL95_00190 [Magnetococcales bacterium]|nr:hypothetical protein [Magnetococcales bacterium]